jgi:hypothetical protein
VIAVNHPVTVRGIERVQNLLWRERPFLEPVGERFAFQILHNQKTTPSCWPTS